MKRRGFLAALGVTPLTLFGAKRSEGASAPSTIFDEFVPFLREELGARDIITEDPHGIFVAGRREYLQCYLGTSHQVIVRRDKGKNSFSVTCYPLDEKGRPEPVIHMMVAVGWPFNRVNVESAKRGLKEIV